MAVMLPRRSPRLRALAWLAVAALLLLASSGCHGRNVPAVPSAAAAADLPASTPPPPPSPGTAPPPFVFPRPICRRCPPRCPPEGCRP